MIINNTNIRNADNKIREFKDDLFITLCQSTSDEIRNRLHHKRFAEIFMINRAVGYLISSGEYEYDL